jgi:hypothetical protein
MRKAQGYFVGGCRAFGFDMVVPNEAEQHLIEQIKSMRERGYSLLAIHRWLTGEMGVKLAHLSMTVYLNS